MASQIDLAKFKIVVVVGKAASLWDDNDRKVKVHLIKLEKSDQILKVKSASKGVGERN